MNAHGGRRPGAGRRPGTGRYQGEQTRVMRIPLAAVPVVDHVLEDFRKAQLTAQVTGRPVMRDPPKRSLGEFSVRVPAGSLGFTDDLAEDECDLHELLVRDSSTTYVYTVCGDSMDRAGIFDGDKVLVDRDLEARDGDIVVAVLSGEGHTLKRLRISQDHATLIPESSNPRHRPRRLRSDEEWLVWGVVTVVIRKLRSRPTATTTKTVRSRA